MAEIANYKVASSPHKTSEVTTRRIMLDVLIALAPCLICGVVFYGLYALLLVVISVALTLIAGIIPSRSAAKKDPVVALRSE